MNNPLKDIIFYTGAFLKKDKRRDEVLKSYPFLEGFSLKDFYYFNSYLHERWFQEKEIFFKEEDFASALYFLVEGEVEVFYKKEKVGELKQGDYFGEDAFILGQSERKFTIQAKTKSLVLVLLQSELEAMTEEKPLIAARFLYGFIGSLLLKFKHEA